VPGYIIVQLIGGTLAALFLRAVIEVSATFASNYPAAGYSNMSAFWMEFILTLGLVSVILGTASGAQNIGMVGAFGVGAYIALAGLWGSPISGTSMNPARTFGPDLVGRDWTGVRRRTDRGRRRRRAVRVRAAWPRWRGSRIRRSPRRAGHRGRDPRSTLTTVRAAAAVALRWHRRPQPRAPCRALLVGSGSGSDAGASCDRAGPHRPRYTNTVRANRADDGAQGEA
jgi:hypothetical protein